jgi:hypothetical protein
MRAIKTDTKELFIDLNKSNLPEAPFCKDIFHFKTVEQHFVLLTYTLQLFDDFREIIGELKLDAEIESNHIITSFQMDKFMADLSYKGRERFNEEAAKLHIKMFIPKISTMHIVGLDAA